MIPESQPLPLDVDVWLTESVFVHVTVVPAATSRLSGVNARFPRTSAPIGMLTVDDVPPGVGAGAGVGEGLDGDELSLPQASAPSESARASMSRMRTIASSDVDNRKTRPNIPNAWPFLCADDLRGPSRVDFRQQ